MVALATVELTVGVSVVQCADTASTASGSGNSRPSRCQNLPGAPASSASIGEPWERKIVGSFAAMANLRIDLGYRSNG